MGKVNPEKQQMGKIVITFPISSNFSFYKCCLQTVLSLLTDLYLENRETRIPKRRAHISLPRQQPKLILREYGGGGEMYKTLKSINNLKEQRATM